MCVYIYIYICIYPADIPLRQDSKVLDGTGACFMSHGFVNLYVYVYVYVYTPSTSYMYMNMYMYMYMHSIVPRRRRPPSTAFVSPEVRE